MLSKTRLRFFYYRSIKGRFLAQLVLGSSVLLAVFSFIAYLFIQLSIYDDLSSSLLKRASYIAQNYTTSKDDFEIITDKSISKVGAIIKKKIDERLYLIAISPIEDKKGSFVKIKQDISATETLLKTILKTVAFVYIFSILLIIIFATFLSNTLLLPIKQLTKQLGSMNENFLASINVSLLPSEFKTLGIGINNLIKRIQNYTKYQKELFIGTAHELKTPLAVMKTKNEVTLIKQRDAQTYIETLKLNNKKIDDMNNMISSILKVGRQESAQFERPIDINIVLYLQEQLQEFRLISKAKNITIKESFQTDCFQTLIQPTLLLHIIQNFMQNAIKFSPENGIITIKVEKFQEGLHIQIIDNGPGIDENEDLFAPFKRIGNQAGAGLGLFLAKSAADGLGASIELKNRNDGKSGCIATLTIFAHCSCDLQDENSDEQ